MAEGLLVYFVVKGPVPLHLPDGKVLWQVEAKVSGGGGGTVEPMVFTFGTEEQAIAFKRKVNYTMEPTIIGEEDE